ncbi:MAG: hypothetical protein HC899_39225 [Leptolyngbyaceae cyanobacterium SM1_4_3]|nr:hypothetical protein [Leptolyngbyaceae cyanobacterium SM1_4_3]
MLAASPRQIANALIQGLSASTVQRSEGDLPQPHYLDSLQKIWQHSNIRATSEGWLQWQLHPSGLATWLQALAEIPLQPGVYCQINHFSGNDNQFFPTTTIDFFTVHHTYARCRSLLQQAKQAGLIKFTVVNLEIDRMTFPLSFCPSWLDAQGQLHFTHWAEYQLIRQLAIGLDDVAQCILH